MSAIREHVAKEILSGYGVRLPSGSVCATAAEARAAAEQLGGAVYVKAQAAVGDRLASGLVRRAADPDDAFRAAEDLLTTVAEVLVEEEIAARTALYIAVTIRDEGPARYLLVGDNAGSGFDPSTASVVLRLAPGRPPEGYELRKALAAGGFTSQTLLEISRLALAAIACTLDWHLYTLELNPVLLGPDGPVVVDAKMEPDAYAAALVPDSAKLADPDEDERERGARLFQQGDHRGSLRYIQLVREGDEGSRPLAGTHSVGGGESLVVLDALAEVGVEAANYCDTSGSPSQEKVAYAAELVATQRHISCLYFSSCVANQPLTVTARGLVDGLSQAGWSRPGVIRIAGNEEVEAIAIVREWAEASGLPIEIYGREIDEWQAAARVAALLGGGDDGVLG